MPDSLVRMAIFIEKLYFSVMCAMVRMVISIVKEP